MQFAETYRSVVSPSDCDHLGHMNVSKYFAACSDGVTAFQTGLGLGPNDLRNGRKLSFAVVHAESDFKAEVSLGEVICLRTGVKEIGVKSIVLRHQLVRVEDDAVVFETVFRCVLLDLVNRKAVAIPDDGRVKVQPYLQ
jgi:acyl-CoA thioester hydrolase